MARSSRTIADRTQRFCRSCSRASRDKGHGSRDGAMHVRRSVPESGRAAGT